MTQPPGFGQPGPYAPPPGIPLGPPPRRGAPWWIWVLGGCGGCVVIMFAGLIAAGLWFRHAITSAPPLTPTAARQQLGPDVPLYPNATLDPATNQATGM